MLTFYIYASKKAMTGSIFDETGRDSIMEWVPNKDKEDIRVYPFGEVNSMADITMKIDNIFNMSDITQHISKMFLMVKADIPEDMATVIIKMDIDIIRFFADRNISVEIMAM